MSVSLRYGLSGSSPIGEQTQTDFHQYDVAATLRLPWQWYHSSGWGLSTRLVLSGGALTGANETNFIATAVPVVAFGCRDERFSIDMGGGGASEGGLFEQCGGPGKACQTAADCAGGEYCETALGTPQPDGGGGDAGVTDGGKVCTQPVPVAGKCVKLPPICPDDAGAPDGGTCVQKCEYHPPAGVLTAVPLIAFGDRDGRVTVDAGAGGALLTRHRFGLQDFGGPFQFVGTAGLSAVLFHPLAVGYRFHHFSVGTIYGRDSRGVDLHLFEIGYRF